jgi:predicted Zn-dependent peptidase
MNKMNGGSLARATGLTRSLIALALVFATVLAHAAAAPSVQVPRYERVQLQNGATFLLMERHDVPMVTFTAMMRGGASADPPGRSGTASLLAELLEKGAGKRDAFSFAETIASVGGSIETSADTESIVVSGSFLARDHALMIELLSDMLLRPSLDAAQFETLRARQIEFLRAAKDSDLESLLPIYGAANLFGEQHPYGRPVDGSEASLAAASHDSVSDFYRQHFGAERLILAVAGDFKSAPMKQALTRAFSGWRKAAQPLPQIPEPSRVSNRRVLLVDAPESVQSYFWAGSVAVSRSDPRRAPLDIVNTLFGGRFTSMLNTELRVRSGLSYGARSGFRKLARSGSWQISSFTRTETTIEAIDLALTVLDRLRQREAVDASLIESGKAYVLGQFPLGFETAAQWSYQLATLELYGLDRRYIEGYGPALQAVTLGDAGEVVEKVLPKSDGVVLVVIGKAEAIRQALGKYGPVTEMKLSDPAFAPASSATSQ